MSTEWVLHVEFSQRPDQHSMEIIDRVIATTAQRAGADYVKVSGPPTDLHVAAIGTLARPRIALPRDGRV